MTTKTAVLDSASPRAPDLAVVTLATSPATVRREQKVDQALDDSFPASDPPSWTLGRLSASAAPTTASRKDDDRWSSHTTVIVAGGKPSAWQLMADISGAIGVGLLVPLAILAIGSSIALAAHAVLAAAGAVSSFVLR